MLLASVMGLSFLGGCASGTQTAVQDSQTTAADAETGGAAADTTAAAEGKDYENVTIRFDWWGGDARHEATQKAVDAFMAKYPGITVEVNFGAWTDWETARALEYQSGTGSDLTQINFSWIPDYSADGSTFIDLRTVSDVLDLSQYGEEYLAMCEDVKGGLAGIPIAMTGRIFYWDKTTFDEAGIETPASLAELREAGKIFKERLGDDYYPLALGYYDRAIFMLFYLQSKYGTEIISPENTLNFTKEQLKEGLDFIQSLEDDHVIPSIKTIDGDGAKSFDVNEKFIDGRYAGILEWDSAPAKFKSALGDARELVVGEEFTDLGGATAGVFSKVSMMYAITSTSKHPREAAMLLNFLVNDPEGIKLIGTQRGIPLSKIAYETLEKEGKLEATSLEAYNKVMTAAGYYFSPKFDDAALKGDNGAYKEVFGGISYGDYDTEEGAQILFDTFESVLQ